MKNHSKTYYVGIDISKEKLDVFAPFWDEAKSYENRPEGRRELFDDLARVEGAYHLICEATGGYEAPLMLESFERKLNITLVNPRQVRDFAKAKGLLAKTDKIDAATISHFGEVFTPQPTAPHNEAQQRLIALNRRRERLMSHLVREKSALQKSSDAFVRKDHESMIRILEKRIKKFDEEISKLIQTDETLKNKSLRLQQVKGIGAQTANTILAEMPELGSLEARKASALIGLAPMNCDSGKRRGKRCVQGGRGQVRRALYMPAMSAIRFNPILKAFYDRLRAKGKDHHVAITAVMRKLICLLNRILSDPNFCPA